jgi:transposase
MPNSSNCSLADFDIAIAATPRKKDANRLVAIKALLLDDNRIFVTKLFNVSERTLCGWISRFNKSGIDGLIDKARAGRPRKISKADSPSLRKLIEDPEQAKIAHWTAKKFHGYLRDELGREVGYRTVVRWLHEEGFRLKVPQPWPDRQDESLRESFVERLQEWIRDESIDLWFGDEMGVEGDPRPRRRWAMKGSKPRVTKNGDHMRMNVMGIICPRRGDFYAMEFTHSDTDCFQVYLNQANQDISWERSRNLLIMDNASWHKTKSLQWGRFEPVYLPPYSPDLNPIERLWLLIKAEWFSDFVAKTADDLLARLDKALLWAMGRQEGNRQTCTIKQEL